MDGVLGLPLGSLGWSSGHPGASAGYIVTDGVLLGSYKFGGMLDWDADVVWRLNARRREDPGDDRNVLDPWLFTQDLHIHNDDFHLLED